MGIQNSLLANQKIFLVVAACYPCYEAVIAREAKQSHAIMQKLTFEKMIYL